MTPYKFISSRNKFSFVKILKKIYFKSIKHSVINNTILINIFYTFKVDFLTINYRRDQLGAFQIRPYKYSNMQIKYQMMKGRDKVML